MDLALLEKYKKEIESAKRDVAQDTGMLRTLSDQLEQLIGTKDVVTAEQKVYELQQQKEAVDKEAEELFSAMKESYPL